MFSDLEIFLVIARVFGFSLFATEHIQKTGTTENFDLSLTGFDSVSYERSKKK